ncbi:hypothetical protein [Halorubrum sp. Ea1]|uniref:hypothetical protein n=1 Tax=Halorubrum sp. Ea1 TaxID=1480718 RepID=UPI0011405F51|nr:hypothetical protein [Halorubrum sp. Ea1]
MREKLYLCIMALPTPSREHSPSADEAVAKLRLWFSELSLRELETREVVNWDRDENVVKRGRDFDTMWNRVKGQNMSLIEEFNGARLVGTMGSDAPIAPTNY